MSEHTWRCAICGGSWRTASEHCELCHVIPTTVAEKAAEVNELRRAMRIGQDAEGNRVSWMASLVLEQLLRDLGTAVAKWLDKEPQGDPHA
jgi:hypothetical protein